MRWIFSLYQSWRSPMYSSRHFLVGATLVGSIFFCPDRVMGQGATIAEIMAKACPVAHAIDKERERASALADDSQYALARQAAQVFYDCYQNLANPYQRDYAHLTYLYQMLFSVNPANAGYSAQQALGIVEQGANDLAADTQYSDVRDGALKLRKVAQSMLNVLSSPQP
jgi:hypothetical protein